MILVLAQFYLGFCFVQVMVSVSRIVLCWPSHGLGLVMIYVGLCSVLVLVTYLGSWSGHYWFGSCFYICLGFAKVKVLHSRSVFIWLSQGLCLVRFVLLLVLVMSYVFISALS